MTWLDRILATPCECGRGPGEMCVRDDEAEDGVPMVCASRIAAAEGVANAEHSFLNQPIVWFDNWSYATACRRCGAFKSIPNHVGDADLFSHDDGKTWTPGPDACPGRRP